MTGPWSTCGQEPWYVDNDEAHAYSSVGLGKDGEVKAIAVWTGEHDHADEMVAALNGFDRIVAARKAYVDATTAYNARHALAQSERARGNWSIKLDAEYRTMSDAQSEFIRVAQEVADAALTTSGTDQ